MVSIYLLYFQMDKPLSEASIKEALDSVSLDIDDIFTMDSDVAEIILNKRILLNYV